MPIYSVYGLTLHSAISLPELIPGVDAADVELTIGELGQAPVLPESAYCLCWESADGVYLFWKDVAMFFIRNGREIVVDPVAGAEERRIRLVLLGAVFSIILQQRGYLIFHASALAINGAGVMFIGDKGWGKSTMAAALHRRGHGFMADDVVAVDDRDQSAPSILPAFPQIKLWTDALSAMGENPEDFPSISILVDKRENRLSNGFMSSPVPLRCIYVLGLSEETSPEVKPLKPREALVYLIGQTYSARWGKEMFEKSNATHLTRCTSIVNSVPIHHLLRPKSLELLPTIVEMIEEHLASIDNN